MPCGLPATYCFYWQVATYHRPLLGSKRTFCTKFSTRWEARKHVKSLISIMKTAIVRDHALLISGFGKFEAYAKKARKGRNPATNEAMILGPRRVVVFRVSKKFRDELK